MNFNEVEKYLPVILDSKKTFFINSLITKLRQTDVRSDARYENFIEMVRFTLNYSEASKNKIKPMLKRLSASIQEDIRGKELIGTGCEGYFGSAF